MASLTEQEFAQFQRFIFDAAGISLASSKQALVSGRLAARLSACRVASYSEYLRLLRSGRAPAELQRAVDLLTTNETFFFREPEHFALLKRRVVARAHGPGAFRVWSAAASSGEEAYSAAMVLEDCLPGGPWEVVGTDVSVRVLERARAGIYPLARLSHVPKGYLRRFCLKGVGERAGTLLITQRLREKVSFHHGNLNGQLPKLGLFDLVFLRNVLIYFNFETQAGVVERVLASLKPGGLLLIGHSENLPEAIPGVKPLAPSVFEKTA